MTITPWSDAAKALVGAAFGNPSVRKDASEAELNDAKVGQANAAAAADQLQTMLRQQQYNSLDPTYGTETMNTMSTDPAAAMGRMLATGRNPTDYVTALSALQATAPGTSDLEADRLGRRALIGSAKDPGPDFSASRNMAQDVAARKAGADDPELAAIFGVHLPPSPASKVGPGTSSYLPPVAPIQQGYGEAQATPAAYEQVGIPAGPLPNVDYNAQDDALPFIPGISNISGDMSTASPNAAGIQNVSSVQDLPPAQPENTAGFDQLIQGLTAPAAQVTQTPVTPAATTAGMPDILNDPSLPNKLAIYAARKGKEGLLRAAETMNQNDLAQKAAAKLPPAVAQGYLDNQTAQKNIQDALSLIDGKTITSPSGATIKGNKDAVGIKGFLPEQILQRTDPEGVSTRAIIADIGSLKLHDRSGASVTISESPRLLPFIPSASDEPDVVKKKLTRLLFEYQNTQKEMDNLYGGQGYNVPGGAAPTNAGPVQIKGDDDYNALPSGTSFIAPDGTTRTKP